jgi:cell wall assembly regulator SMI1
MGSDMRALWTRLGEHAARSSFSLRLRPGASEAAIRRAEATLGLRFPNDFRASLLLHDGQEPGTGELDVFPWLPGHDRLASLEAIIAQWQSEQTTYAELYCGDPAVPPEEIEDGTLYHYFWHPRRIPIAGNLWFDQDNTYLDFFPGPAGVAGQLAVFGKGTYGAVHGPSFGGALACYADALDRGDFAFRDGDVYPAKKSVKSWWAYVRKRSP